MWTDGDFEKSFRMRDALKHDVGLEACSLEFASLYKRDPSYLPHALNYGICLLETERHREAEALLGEISKSDKLEQIGYDWFFEAVKFYTLSIMGRSAHVAIEAALERLPLFDRVNQSRIINHTLTHLADHTNIDQIIFALDKNQDGFSLSRPALRKLYEILSSINSMEKFQHICNQQEESSFDEINLIKLMHYNFPDNTILNNEWKNIYCDLKSKNVQFSPFDAYRLSLQMHQRLGFGMAQQEIQGFIDLGDEYFSCYWPLGALLESMGSVAAASQAYASAGIRELQRENQPIIGVKQIDRSNVKISCIALSFNDAPLVETFCRMIQPHCDEIIVNDGGSVDRTVELFKKYSADTGFPIHVILDQQASFRDRNVLNKDGYRRAGLGGVKGFEADRRRTTTLLLAQHDYIVLADLDDFFPAFPNLKTIVSANYGVDHIGGSKRELIDQKNYCDLYQAKNPAMPTLFKRDRFHVFSGISNADEYLARLDQSLAFWASRYMATNISKAYHFWHLKWLLDPSQKANDEAKLGVKSPVSGILQRPDIHAILEVVLNHHQSKPYSISN